MIVITDNGIQCIQGDIFNILTVPEVWDEDATYTCLITGTGVSKEVSATKFRNKYVRIYSDNFNLKAGTYTLTLKKGSNVVLTKALMIKEVSHNE